VFQLYFPAKTMEEAWGTHSPEEGRKQCVELAEKLRGDGWDEAFLKPLQVAESVIRVGLFSREPLDKWVDASRRIVLLGDAAHPPVPYIGQGAMMAMEDAGVLVHLLKKYCCAGGERAFTPSTENLTAATEQYEAMRVARTRKVLGSSHTLGKTQQRRAESWVYNLQRELTIRLQVALHGTLPIMKPGAAYDFAEDVKRQVGDAEETHDAPTDASLSPTIGNLLVAPPAVLLGGVVAVAAAAALFSMVRRR